MQTDRKRANKTIKTMRGVGRSLRPYVTPDLSEVASWLAQNEILDPEGPEDMFEPIARHGVLHQVPTS